MTVPEGHYYKKQLGCQSQVIAWSHGARFKKAIALVGSHPDKLLLDYGCGDGTFLGMVADKFRAVVGADIAADQIDDCRKRFGATPGITFLTIGGLAGDEHTHAYHTVTCMETLEHCPAPAVEIVLGDLSRLVSADGRVIISVPIEIGPTFLFKLVIRKLAAWRNLSDYRYYENYSFTDARKMIFANRSTVVDRPIYGEPGAQYHSHYGFNWRRMRDRIGQSFHIERTVFTPLGFLGGWFSSQAWFICRPK